MSEDVQMRELILGGVPPTAPRINLRDLGFVYRVSDEALAAIRRNEDRAAMVLKTADQFLFD